MWHPSEEQPVGLCSDVRRLFMRMLLNVEFPHEPFNTLVRNGTVGQIIGRILE